MTNLKRSMLVALLPLAASITLEAAAAQVTLNTSQGPIACEYGVASIESGDFSFNCLQDPVLPGEGNGPSDKQDQPAVVVNANPTSFAIGETSTLNATGGAGTGGLNYAIVAGLNNCSLSNGNIITGLAAGNCSVSATKSGDDNYNPRASVPIQLTVTGPSGGGGTPDNCEAPEPAGMYTTDTWAMDINRGTGRNYIYSATGSEPHVTKIKPSAAGYRSGTLSASPHGSNSPNRTVAISTCPGDFNVPDACVRSRGMVTLNWSTIGEDKKCPIDPEKTYYINVKFTDGATGATTCKSGSCTFLMSGRAW